MADYSILASVVSSQGKLQIAVKQGEQIAQVRGARAYVTSPADVPLTTVRNALRCPA